MTNPSDSAEELRDQMRQLRSHMDADVDCLVENTRVLLDWRSYYRSAPWLCLGAAAVAGFLVVPSKVKWMTVDLAHLAEAAKDRQVVVTDRGAKEKESIGSSMTKTIAGFAWRTLLAVATQQLKQYLSQQPPRGRAPAGGDRP